MPWTATLIACSCDVFGRITVSHYMTGIASEKMGWIYAHCLMVT